VGLKNGSIIHLSIERAEKTKSTQTAIASNTPARVVNGVDLDVLEGNADAISWDSALGKYRIRVNNVWNSGAASCFRGAGRENWR